MNADRKVGIASFNGRTFRTSNGNHTRGTKMKCTTATQLGTSKKRQIVLIDIENIVESARDANTYDFADVFGRVAAAVDLQRTDHVVVSANPALVTGLFAMHDLWPSAQIRPRHGRDGADLALLDSVRDTHQVARSYDRAVIASGDGCFTPLAIDLRTVGVATVVVARPESTSIELRSESSEYIPLGSHVEWAVAS
ncbi:MAG: NYN domain-containing protein [Microthrixaceae bacterium]